MNKKLRSRALLALLACSLVTLIAVVVVLRTGSAPAPRLAALSDIALAPYLSGSINAQARTPNGVQQLAGKRDPLLLFRSAFRLLVAYEHGDRQALAQARRILDFMLTSYEPANRSPEGTRWMYGFNYEHGIKAPWWSGMDAFMGPMTLYAAWQITGETAYRDAALKSARLATRSPSEGGALWKDGDTCWISEFSWNGIQRPQEFHVLNGHLWGLQSLYMLAAASGDQQINDAYECAKRGTLSRANQFLNASSTWTWYQLVPKVINPVDYHLLELTQFRAMHALTGDDGYVGPMEARIRTMMQGYPLVLKRSPSGAMSVVLPKVGPPHPYVSIPQPVLRCTVEGRDTEIRGSGEIDRTVSFAQQATLELPVSSTPSHCIVAFSSTVENQIYEQTEFQIVEAASANAIEAPIAVGLDAIGVVDRTVTISPRFQLKPGLAAYENEEARITMQVGQEVRPSDNIVVSLSPKSSSKIGAILEDDQGNASMRYLPRIRAGQRNVIVLNRMGFEGNDAMVPGIRNLSLRLFTDQKAADFSVSIDGVWITRNAVELQSVLDAAGAQRMALDEAPEPAQPD